MYGTITITSVPAGEAPLWVREAWVELKLPGVSLPLPAHIGEPFGILSSQPVETTGLVWVVPQREALDVLAQHNERAATWWRKHGFPRGDASFCFNLTEAKGAE